MKKTSLTALFCLFIFSVSAQCVISPFIQQNYDVDANILALREIQSNVNDPDYDNPYIPQTRVDYHLEKLSAIYENPDNNPSIDSLFTKFQFHVNTEYNEFQVSYEKIVFSVFTNVSWVQTLITTGTSGFAPLDDFMAQYQLTYSEHFSSNSSGKTFFTLQTSHDALNMLALIDDLESMAGIIEAFEIPSGIDNRFNYTGVLYYIVQFPNVSFQTELCDIIFDENQNYQFMLGGGDCFAGCGLMEFRYLTVSNDCNQVTYSRTLSTEDLELSNVSIYPNPASDNLHIKGITNIQTVEMYSILGKKIEVSLDNSTTVDVSILKSGVYFLKVIDFQNRSIIKKFIKK
ncbi:hypothetical protein IMCC3317_27030 [Kordia antarctica]|uniref:Secretion system C-terminal sorting domain-containing protein n=1 Tax=Kordia antarctica TaxID=1218801 RepID=A0A7L4ZN39_9FLAO|nr:T9SS type A sorting domain-containing protein [Kordia antarctica]QHI37324.1 hypothetical protein IMCC3317_27030 [Kordia antarctica]